jgi:hypothetical protein
MCRPPTEVALLQRTVDRSELGVQLSAEAIHDGDNREGNASGDQSVFDRGRARFVGKKPADGRGHPDEKR